MIDSGDSTDSDDLKLHCFLRWLVENGAKLPSLGIGSEQGLRGLISTAPIHRGELALHVPTDLFITIEVAEASSIGQMLAARNVEVSHYGLMAAFLLDNRRDGCFWKPYVDVLPREYPDHPLFFSDEEMRYLNGSYVQRGIAEHRHWASFEWSLINTCLPPERQFTLNDFALARCAVVSRAFGAMINDRPTVALVPLADMANHASESDLTSPDEADKGLTRIAATDIDAGMHVWHSYGPRCNATLFQNYGFCLENNPYNVADIELSAWPKNHPCHAYADKLGQPRGQHRLFSLGSDHRGPAACAVFSFLRLRYLEDGARAEQLLANGCKLNEIPPIDRENELAALATLAEACRRALANFSSSIEEDVLLLRDQRLPSRLRYAVMVRHGEKRILKSYLDLTQAAIPVLQNPGSELVGYTGSGTPFSDYFADLLRFLGTGERILTQPTV